MSNPVGSILRRATRRPGERLNVLSFPTHERWQSAMATCNADFYLFRGQGIKDWNYQYAPLPANHVLLDPTKKDRQIPTELDFDMILCQSIWQWPVASQLSRLLHVPIVRVEHTLPLADWPKEVFDDYLTRVGHMSVTVSEVNRVMWQMPQDTKIIEHGIDIDFWCPDKTEPKAQLITVCNDFINRDVFCGFKLWQKVTEGLDFKVVGDTPGLSKGAGMEELRQFYRESLVYLNTTLLSSSPVSPLEAMACGRVVVSTDTTSLPTLIEHGVNGFLASPDKPEELRGYCEMLLNDKALAKQMGEQARKTVVERFSIPRFVSEWNAVFEEAAQLPYLGAPA